MSSFNAEMPAFSLLIAGNNSMCYFRPVFPFSSIVNAGIHFKSKSAYATSIIKYLPSYRVKVIAASFIINIELVYK